MKDERFWAVLGGVLVALYVWGVVENVMLSPATPAPAAFARAAIVAGATMAALVLFVLPPVIVWLDLRAIHRRTRTEWASVDIMWVGAAAVFQLLGPLVWFLVGRRTRRRELSGGRVAGW